MNHLGVFGSARDDLGALLASRSHAIASPSILVELSCSVLLAFGLLTRAAAMSLTIALIAAHSSDYTADTKLFLAAILVSYVVFGPRNLSIDAMIAPGLGDSALPLMSRIIDAVERFTASVGPLFQLALRLWLGWALLQLPATPAAFPIVAVHSLLPPALAAIGGLMIALGLGTSVANKVLLLVALGTHMIMGHTDGFVLSLVLALVGVLGAGPWSFDDLTYARLVEWMKQSVSKGDTNAWPHVIIVGAGFGGLACASRLRHLPVHLTIIDRQNYHLFQPLLYQVATAGLSPADIASPIRSNFRDDLNVKVIMGTVSGVDKKNQTVRLGDRTLHFDILILATGATHSYYGREDWSRFAPGLKRVDDATAIRGKLLSAFERAENEQDDATREAWLTFVIVGGGATGVELAGAIAELAHFGLKHEFRVINPASAKIVLLHSGPRILPTFPATLSERARRSLERLGVTVNVDSRVSEINADGVTVGDRLLPAKTVLWAAGVVASPVAPWLEVEPDSAGRTPVDSHLRVTGQTNIFVIGDAAASHAWKGRPVPGLAAAAKQMGEHVARVIRARLEMRREPKPFVYSHRGSLAAIGRKTAVAEFGRAKLWGATAWWLWGLIHLLFLTGMRNRMSVVTAWIWAYITFRSGTRLITGVSGDAEELL
jgi:NADH dehydrogenase/putative oxidoreductase